MIINRQYINMTSAPNGSELDCLKLACVSSRINPNPSMFFHTEPFHF
jgi:hypothetical protein